MKSRKLLLGIALVSLVCSACSGHHRQVAVYVPAPPPPASSGKEAERTPETKTETTPGTGAERAPISGRAEVGYASWYGNPYHGRRAANGEIYDMNKLTAAHLTLPFGTQAKVIDLESNRSVVVRITDRGPFVKGRIVDLSLAAARAIRMVGPGTALVRLEVLSVPAEPEMGAFAVQVGAFRDRAVAERLRERLLHRYGNAFIQNYDSGDGPLYRVRVGPKPSLSQAHQLAGQLGRESLRAFVVRVEN
jgi:rare lipoprotein A